MVDSDSSMDDSRQAPALTWDPALLMRAQPVRLAVFDVDGVLTDGRLWIGEQGEQLKAFHALDGHGLKLLAASGVTVAIVTGRDSPPLRRRLKDLGLEANAHFGVHHKLAVVDAMRRSAGLGWDAVAAIGDDWPDLPVLMRCGLACAPPGAHAEVLARVHWITPHAAGRGAGRDLCDLLLGASGAYRRALAQALQADGATGTLDAR